MSVIPVLGGMERGADVRRYHHLNHYAIFGGGYKSSAVSIMRELHR